MRFGDTYHWPDVKKDTARKFMIRAAELKWERTPRAGEDISPKQIADLIRNTYLSKRSHAEEAIKSLEEESRWPWAQLETVDQRHRREVNEKLSDILKIQRHILERLDRIEGGDASNDTEYPDHFVEWVNR